MASQKKAHRHYLLCPVCLKTQQALSMHLRRVCMKKSTEEAIEAEVEKAKDDAHEVLASGRLFSYVVLQQIMGDHDPLTRMIEELQRHHMTVIGVPPPPPNANVVAEASTSTITQPPESAASETRESEQSDQASVSSGKMSQCYPNIKYTNPTRKQMEKKGLYKKHSLDYPLLKDFGKYLEKELQNENFKQEVENVARYLYYVDPQAPSLGFVRNREKLRQYLCELSEANLKRQTQQNYLKALKRFLVYHTVNTNLRHEDEALHGDCRAFIDYIGFLQDICSKQVSKEITQKRHNMLIEKHQLTTSDCWAVLSAAKKDFLAVIDKVFDNTRVILDSSECLLVLYYLEAIIILKHLQRPGVVEHMTVQEWISRKKSGSNVIIGVKEHKTAAQQVATFALTDEEECWFDTYYTLVRPQLLTCKKRKRVEDEGEKGRGDRFFISSTGRAIHNASNDLHRLQSKYNLPSVTSQAARRIFETATKGMTDAEKSLVADYLGHSNATAEKHYRMREADNIVKASRLLATLAGDSSGDCAEEGPSRGAPSTARDAAGSTNVQMEIHEAFDHLLKTHPVTLDGEVPDITVRKKVFPGRQRQLYERWLKAQMKLRVRHVRSYFCRRRPSEERIKSWITKQGWKSNIPTPHRILRDWVPSGSEDNIMDCKPIRKLVRSQKWKGLLVCDIEGKSKGVLATRKGVLATRRFQAGEVLCDYHGRVVTRREGQKIHQSTGEKETGYMFFYRNKKGQAMCIDAHSTPCECHPKRETVGRMINHSKKKANLKPKFCSVETGGEERDVILLLATRTIDVNEELLFDKRSFGGEGEKLD